MSCPDIPYRTALTLKNETSSPIHGGASSDPDHKDGTVKAARIAIECLRDGKTALGAVVKSIEMFENDPRLTLGQGLLFVKTGKRPNGCCLYVKHWTIRSRCSNFQDKKSEKI